jgi:outer membrane lipoprotein LolB
MFTLTRLLCVVMLLVSATMTGCVNRGALKTVLRPAQYDAPFSFNGRVSIKRNMDSSSASLRWVHNPEEDEDEILILEPLGQTIARIHRDVQGATLEAQGRFYVSQDVESLTQQVLGWTFPLALMTHWVVGVPAAEKPTIANVANENIAEVQRDAKKQITLIRQAGWEIHYSRYAGNAANSLPTRFVMKKDKLEITVLIDEWEKLQL